MENMKLNINKDGKLELNGQVTKLTNKQMEDLGLNNKFEFRIEDKDEVYYINKCGEVKSKYFFKNDNNDVIMRDNYKYSKNKCLMEQQALRRNLNDLILGFAVENDFLSNQVSDPRILKFFILINYYGEDLLYTEIRKVKYSLNFETIYFNNEDGCKKCINKVILPYLKKHKEEWDWDYGY